MLGMAKVEAIDESSAFLADVKKLWRSHSATLGFLPDGGFRSYARERHVVVALDDNNHSVGRQLLSDGYALAGCLLLLMYLISSLVF
jgi:hypothetical protein